MIGALLLLGGLLAAAHEHRGSLERYVAYLEDPGRAAWQKPAEVVAALALAGDETVADLGAGTGYFSVLLARAVTHGRVIALDVDERLVAHLGGRLEREKVANATTRRVAPDDAGLEPGSVDLVFLCNVYHHLENRPAYMRRAAAALTGRGRVAIVDFHKRREITEGPPFEEKLEREKVVAEMREAGFRLVREHDFLPLQYFLEFALAPRAAVGELAAGVAAVVRQGLPEDAMLEGVGEVLDRFLARGVLDERAHAPHPGLEVTTYLLHVDPLGAFSIAALVIRVGGRTPVHDHGTWTVWGTLSGRDRETRFARGDREGGRIAELVPAGTSVLPDDGLSLLRGSPEGIHRVENVGTTPSVSIHVHGGDISRQVRNAYDPDKRTMTRFVQSYERIDGSPTGGER